MRLSRAALLTALSTLLLAAPAHGQIPFHACDEETHFACGHLTVPLDPAGVVPGTITLALRRHRAPLGEGKSAIVALAGGPGQPALPFAEQFTKLLGPIAASRDLIVLDQRGTGLSGPLSCHALERPDLFRTFGSLIAACASQLGAARSLYTTEDTVADLEALRQAGGYEKLVLYGTSYGTKVAELYAQRYPSHVEALVLDSVVPPDGPDPFNRSTFAAIPRVLRQVCARRACVGITPDPERDLARLLARTARHGIEAPALNGEGEAVNQLIDPEGLFSFLLGADFAPFLRAQLVTADRAAARGDTSPLARLLKAVGESGGGEREDFDQPLYFATSCEDELFPWNHAASPSARLKEAAAAARALPASAFAPFASATALESSDMEACAHWPYAAAQTPHSTEAPLPAVPTLILSGAEDLRTPTANAAALAAQIPGSHLLVVPYTGHAVLVSESGTCARDALLAMFAGRAVEACPATAPPALLTPPPLPPVRVAAVSPLHGYSGRSGRTLHAVALTLADLYQQLALRGELGGGGAGVGGLRSGWVSLSRGDLLLHKYSYIPGLTLSGRLGPEASDLHVGGRAAAAGTLRARGGGSLQGALEGHRVSLPGEPPGAAIVGADVPAGPHESARASFAGAGLAGAHGG
jgi:pimeloyl-ACP methyl ester carboxylesterase